MDRLAAISAHNLTLSYGATRALDKLQCRVEQGEIYGLLGPNGAGKSTFVRILSGLLEPDAGTAAIAGHDVVAERAQARRNLGVVPQDIALYEELSARQNLALFAGLHGLAGEARKQAIAIALTRVGLQARADEPCRGFSGGMLRRLSIAVALVHSPSVLLMDEPTVGLDPQHRNSILDLVQQLALDGMAVLYASHYMDEVHRLAHRVGIVDHGSVIAEGTVPELIDRIGQEHVLELVGGFDHAAQAGVSALEGVTVVDFGSDKMVMHLGAADGRIVSVLQSLASVARIDEVRMNRPTLDDVFMRLTGRALRD